MASYLHSSLHISIIRRAYIDRFCRVREEKFAKKDKKREKKVVEKIPGIIASTYFRIPRNTSDAYEIAYETGQRRTLKFADVLTESGICASKDTLIK